jgi:hypothetical protein
VTLAILAAIFDDDTGAAHITHPFSGIGLSIPMQFAQDSQYVYYFGFPIRNGLKMLTPFFLCSPLIEVVFHA